MSVWRAIFNEHEWCPVGHRNEVDKMIDANFAARAILELLHTEQREMEETRLLMMMMQWCDS